MGGHREGMSQTWEMSWPAEHLWEGLEKTVNFVQRSELAGLGEHRREGEMGTAKSSLHGTNTQDLGELRSCGDTSAAGCRAGFGKCIQRFEGGKAPKHKPQV